MRASRARPGKPNVGSRGCKHVRVECAECLGQRQIKVVDRTFAVVTITCPGCQGKGTISASRRGA